MDWFFKIVNRITGFNFIEIELEGEIPEEEEKFSIPFLPSQKKLTLWDLERVFIHAGKIPDVSGILIKIRDLNIGLAKANSLRRRILAFREKGKKVFAILESGGNIEYLVASAAGRIFVPHWGILNLIGLKAELTFVKDALDKLGIEAELRGLGEYKSAGEMFTRTSMSDQNKEMIESILGDLYEQFLGCLSEGRGIGEQELKKMIDSGPFIAEEALSSGLIDEIGYEEDAEHRIEKIMGNRMIKISAERFLRFLNLERKIKSFFAMINGDKKAVAIVSDSGFITLGESRGSGSAKTLGSKTLLEILDKVAENRSIKAIVLRISTPGGSGVASDLIRHRIKSISEQKPVVVSMSDVGASGGYLIALGGKRIISDPMTLTGSIGVLAGKFNLKSLFDKIGLQKEWISHGDNAMFYSPSKGYSEEEKEKLGQIIESYYRGFVRRFAEERNMDYERAERLARGRVWTGRQAREHGIIDELGGIPEAIEAAKRQAGISDDDVYPVIKFFSKPKGIQFSPFGTSLYGIANSLIESLVATQAFPRVISSGLIDSIKIEPIDDLSLLRESVFTLMPFWIKIK